MAPKRKAQKRTHHKEESAAAAAVAAKTVAPTAASATAAVVASEKEKVDTKENSTDTHEAVIVDSDEETGTRPTKSHSIHAHRLARRIGREMDEYYAYMKADGACKKCLSEVESLIREIYNSSNIMQDMA